MNIKEIIDAERWAPGAHGLAPMPSVDHNAALDRIEDAATAYVAELEEQNLNMMALFRSLTGMEFNRDECWEIIKKYGGDA